MLVKSQNALEKTMMGKIRRTLEKMTPMPRWLADCNAEGAKVRVAFCKKQAAKLKGK